MKRFAEIFADVKDPRAANMRHDFLTVLFIALLGVLCGAQSCAGMAETAPSTAHGRTEIRLAAIAPAKNLDFPGLKAAARVETIRTAQEGVATAIARFFLLSTIVPASRMIDIARTHWFIENQLHWVLDVDLAEDVARTRKDNGPQSFAILRKSDLSLLRTYPDKASIRGKIKKSGWDDSFLLSLIAHMR